MNYSKEIFKKLGIKPNEIFQTSFCDEFVYKMNEDLKGYYFNLNEGELGANINDENNWHDYPALLTNLLTDKTKVVDMDRSTKILVNGLLAIPVPKKTEVKPTQTNNADDLWAQLNNALMQASEDAFKEGNTDLAQVLGEYVSPKFR